MTVLTDDEIVEWLHRLSGGSWNPPAGATGPDRVPEWFSQSMIHMSGIDAIHQLSNMGVVDALEPDRFEAALIRVAVGPLVMFSTLQTAHTVTHERLTVDDVDVVIVGLTQKGGLRLRTPQSIEMMSVGRVGFMSTVGPSVIEHNALTEVTGVVLPVEFLPKERGPVERGAGLFPDSPLTRVVGATFARFIFEWIQTDAYSNGETAATEATLLSLVRSLYQQLPAPRESRTRAEGVRHAATRVIERRHRDSEFGLDELAQTLHISRRQLFRSFEDAIESAGELLLRRRIATAREELLRTPPIDLESAAAASGFSDAAALRAQFTRRLGMSPSEFRRTESNRSGATLAQAMLLSDEQGLNSTI